MRVRSTPSLIAASLFLSWPGPAVRAQSCANPIVIPDNVLIAGDTCAGGNPFPVVGTTPSPHRDLVYRFTLQGQSNAGFSLGQANFAGAALAFAQCIPFSEPLDALLFGPGQPGTMVLSGLPAGDYTLVITTQPDQPSEVCGQFNLLAAGVWSDPIFASGFQSN